MNGIHIPFHIMCPDRAPETGYAGDCYRFME